MADGDIAQVGSAVDIERAISQGESYYNKVNSAGKGSIGKRMITTQSEQSREYGSLLNKMGSAYVGTQLSNYECGRSKKQREMVDAVAAYIEEIRAKGPDGGIIWIGSPGTGKDHCMTAVLKAAVIIGYTADYVRAQEFYAQLRENIRTSSKVDISKLLKPVFLGLSDPVPARRELSGWNAEVLYMVAEARAAEGLPTLVTMNAKGVDDARFMLTAPVFDRLSDKSIIALCDWPSYRKPRKVIGAKP
jgi:DNA replication protein DnaC